MDRWTRLARPRMGLFLLGAVALACAAPLPVGAQKNAARTAPVASSLAIYPADFVLDGSYASQTLSVSASSPNGSARDVAATLASSNPKVVRVEAGVAYPVGDGEAQVVASSAGRSARARVIVRNSKTDASLSFANEITPILLKAGCNGAACHGAKQGQGDFKLSYFGYGPGQDREAIWTGANGRRVNAKDPATSLILMKAIGIVPHGGGKRFARNSPEHRTMLAWIRAGGPLASNPPARSAREERRSGPRLASFASGSPEPVAPRLESLEVWPNGRVAREAASKHQLVVTAVYTDGSRRDVTPLSRFFSDDDGVAPVDPGGVLTAARHGEANVMVRYNGKSGIARFYSIVRPVRTVASPAPANFVDEHVFAKLRTMGMAPSPPASDHAFIRRVFLDIAGVLPLPNRVRDFAADKDPGKRAKLIDELLERPEFVDLMTLQWSELLRINRTFLQEEGVNRYTAFVRDSFAANKPFDQFVRELISSASNGRAEIEKSRDAPSRAEQTLYRASSGYHSGPPNFYRVTADPIELTTSTSQVFLGVRLDCTRCHNHPFDRWTMKDFYGMAAYFSGTGYTGGKVKDEVSIFFEGNGEIANPINGEVSLPKPLTDTQGTPNLGRSRRRALAEWITSPDNPFFARATVNRFWKHFFGRGIVHPVDDFRATNPPVNEPLMNALADRFVRSGYNIKELIRTICNSKVYQLSDAMTATNETDTKNFSRSYSRRLGPEVLHDAIVTATGVPETFGGSVARRATNLKDSNIGSFFLDVFGRSRRLQVQEHSDQASIGQALHLMNGGTINDRIAHPEGRVAGLLKSQMTLPQAVEELYLSTLTRKPREAELKAALYYLENAPSQKEGFEDLMWAILNSREFVFNH